jgi:hypothetical protein
MGRGGNDRVGLRLPEAFCWTKFGAEAGEWAGSIFGRKEIERRRNGGTFLWGIGQSIRPSLLELLRVTAYPEVLFSPIRSAPSSRDVLPADVVLWCEAVGCDGRPFKIPEYSLVTSRRDNVAPRATHFALVCECEDSIIHMETDFARVALGELRNFVSGSPLGSSQVTSVVRRTRNTEQASAEYPIVAHARLVYPYLVRLTHGIPVPRALRLDGVGNADLESAMGELFRLRQYGSTRGGEQLELAL